LREAFANLIPPSIRRRRKMGFGVPLADWFRGELRDYVRDLLLDPNARYREMLSGSFVEHLVATQLDGRADVGKQLWALICFERWLRLLPEWRRTEKPVYSLIP
jgi:asparagine synthase (glutamine-hydrolysing)